MKCCIKAHIQVDSFEEFSRKTSGLSGKTWILTEVTDRDLDSKHFARDIWHLLATLKAWADIQTEGGGWSGWFAD